MNKKMSVKIILKTIRFHLKNKDYAAGVDKGIKYAWPEKKFIEVIYNYYDQPMVTIWIGDHWLQFGNTVRDGGH